MNELTQRRINLKKRWLHHTMSAVGGFFAAYALLNYGNLGNAQTLNHISLMFTIVGHNFGEFMQRLLGLLIYLVGTFAFVVTDHHKLPSQWISLGINGALILYCAFTKLTDHSIIGLYPFFFAMSYQYNCFTGANGYTAASIFSSNNTRQVALALGDFFYTKNHKSLDKAAFFFGALLFFNLGAALCDIFFIRMVQRSILLCFVLLLIAAVLICSIDKTPASEGEN